ncbi:hypothetical protein GYMLUDRAFT_64662 [Collybiopsis luxurians FD-317 M1]|uniref:Uncharacterized protein n=1 Tax=Collybiopsis luxurians FD-317 M1 TaxID=944289 RepID=A0A0D0C1P1_9AGAR|nr:hypothetical protein GYMLUDRAFT_64662 [Collybiopsis luxurians FD-317 M1]
MGQHNTEHSGAIKVHVCGLTKCSLFDSDNYILHVWDREETFTLMVEFTRWLYECHLSTKLQETITKLTNFIVENPGGNEDEHVLEQLILKLGKLNAYKIEFSNDKIPAILNWMSLIKDKWLGVRIKL